MKEQILKKAVRMAFRDAAFQFRMGAGFPGDVNRTHPVDIEAVLIAVATPPTMYGQPVLLAAANAGVRPFAVGDASDATAATPYGFTVRPYPTSPGGSVTAPGAAASFGTGAPPVSGDIDVMRSGLIMVQLNDITATPAKGDPVYVWCAATSGAHIQGGIEAAFSAGNTVELDPKRYIFNSPPDGSGVTEIAANV